MNGRLSRTSRRGAFSILGYGQVVGIYSQLGIVNAWILVGSFKALTATEYGRLLMGEDCAIRDYGCWSLLSIGCGWTPTFLPCR